MKLYEPKRLIDGGEIGQQAGTSWVAIPDKYDGEAIGVMYDGIRMTVNDWRKEAKLFRKFKDKFGREQTYTLGYFKFTPDEDQ